MQGKVRLRPLNRLFAPSANAKEGAKLIEAGTKGTLRLFLLDDKGEDVFALKSRRADYGGACAGVDDLPKPLNMIVMPMSRDYHANVAIGSKA